MSCCTARREARGSCWKWNNPEWGMEGRLRQGAKVRSRRYWLVRLGMKTTQRPPAPRPTMAPFTAMSCLTLPYPHPTLRLPLAPTTLELKMDQEQYQPTIFPPTTLLGWLWVRLGHDFGEWHDDLPEDSTPAKDTGYTTYIVL